MTKPKLTDAVPKSETKPAATVATSGDAGSGSVARVSDAGNSNNPTSTGPPAGSSDAGSSDAAGNVPRVSDAGPSTATANTTANDKARVGDTGHTEKTVADFRSAFGTEQGSVYFTDGLSFSDACVKHMAAQQSAIEALQKQNAELKAQVGQLAKGVLGEAEPVRTGSSDDTKATNEKGAAAYATTLQSKLSGLKF